MSLAVYEQTPTDRIDYDIDFTRWLTDGDVLSDVIAQVEDPTMTFTVDAVEFSASIAKVWVVGGANGEEGEIWVEATTQTRRTKRTCFTMRIKDC